MVILERLRDLDLRWPAQAGRPSFLSAASGLQRVGEWLYVVADDEQHLGIFPAAGTEPGSVLRVFGGDLAVDPAARKAGKRDLEALCRLPPDVQHPHGALLALGSGSRPNRGVAVLLPLAADHATTTGIRTVDLEPLYRRLAREFQELNIEGAVVMGDQLILLQRGNRQSRRNALIRMPLAWVLAALQAGGEDAIQAAPLHIVDVALGTDPAGVPFGLTDACALPGGYLLCSAVAEDTDNTYDDGACNAAMLGILDVSGRIAWSDLLAPAAKIEGVHAEVGDQGLHLLLVSDADDPAVPAGLFRAVIPVADIQHLPGPSGRAGTG